MKEQKATRLLYILLIIWIIAITALTLTACGREEFLSDCPTAPLTESTEPVLCATVLMPEMRLHFLDEEVPCSVALTPSSSYIYREIPGQSTLSKSTRPCDREELCIFYSADPEGIARLSGGSWEESALPALTLTAYPAAEDNTVDLAEEHRQTVAITDGQFRLLRGRYYYEAEVKREEGTVTYGFICYHTDEYEITHHWDGGCIVELISENPDSGQKIFPKIMLEPNLSNNGGIRLELARRGEGSWSYINHADTEIRISWENDMNTDDPRLYVMDEAELIGRYKIDASLSKHKAQKITYTRYAHDGTLLESETEITGNVITFLENSCYVIAVTYEQGTLRYLQKTGAMTLTPHPKDDPAISSKMAYILREGYVRQMRTLNAPTVEDVWLQKYLGSFGAGYLVYMGDKSEHAPNARTIHVADYDITRPTEQPLYVYSRSSFFTVEAAYRAERLTKHDVYQLGSLVDPTFRDRYPQAPILSDEEGGNA